MTFFHCLWGRFRLYFAELANPRASVFPRSAWPSDPTRQQLGQAREPRAVIDAVAVFITLGVVTGFGGIAGLDFCQLSFAHGAREGKNLKQTGDCGRIRVKRVLEEPTPL